MPLSFPIPSVVGQSVVLEGNIWIWDGQAWYIKPTLDAPDGVLADRFALYAWTPYFPFTGFVDGRTYAYGVPNEATRLALRPGLDIAAGRIAMQADTEVLWSYDGANWVVFRELRLSNAALPVVIGVAREGQPLFATLGAWIGEPSSFSYQWLRDGVDVPDAVGPMYPTDFDDVGSRMSVRVTASKYGLADAVATSAETDVTLAGGAVTPLVNTVLPLITGTPQQGKTLSVSTGTWTGYPGAFLYQWLRDGTPIGGATSSTYVPVLSDVQTVLTAAVTAVKDATPNVTATSLGTALILTEEVVAPLVNVTVPVITGTAQEAVTLSASTGTWSGEPTSFSFQWRRAGSNISGATSSTYTPVSADVGKALSVRVTANKFGTSSVSRTSAATAPVLAVALSNTVIPEITGIVQEGMTLTASTGTWAGGPEIYAYQWRRGGVNIAGAINDTYLLTASDAGAIITVHVTASKSGVASLAAVSLETVPVVPMSLSNSGLPIIFGTPRIAETLTATNGTWLGSPTSFAYQWRRGGDIIPGATSGTYVAVTADLGTTLTVTVTVSKDGVSDATATSAATTPVVTNLLSNVARPEITGSVVEGETLTASTGTWTGDPTSFAYQWRRTFAAIAGATSSTYVVSGADAGAVLSVTVTASKASVPDVASTSIITGVVGSTPISNTALPVITGIAAEAEVLTASLGSWTGSPTSYAYQWLRDGAVITGATDSFYGIIPDDAGAVLSVRVTASKVATASVSATSAETAIVTLALPSSVGPPTITGTLTEGQVLTAGGTWFGAPTSFAYQWRRGFTPIPGATASTYTLVAADTGAAMSVTVVGTRDGLSSPVAESELTGVIAALPLVNTVLPVISGTVETGQTLTTTNGTWTGGPTSFAYQWLRNGVAISGATAATYLVPASAEGGQLFVRVTASKRDTANVQATSLSTATIAATPLVNTAVPVIIGTGYQNDLLTATTGTWTGGPNSFAYQWRRNGVNILGATFASYTPVLADVGQVMSVQVTAIATGKTSVVATSAQTAAILAATSSIVSDTLPVISGTVADGQTLTATTGTWLNSPTSFTYQWLRSGVNISGATSSTYLIPIGDLGSTLSVRVVADKVGAAAVAAVSASTSAVVSTPVTVIGPLILAIPSVVNVETNLFGSWDPTLVFSTGNNFGSIYTYQWLRNGVAIPLATSQNYVVQAADQGSVLRLRVTANKLGTPPVSTLSNETPIVEASLLGGGSVRLSGIARQGELLTAVILSPFTGEPTSISYQWKRGSLNIPGATGSTYVLSADDLGAYIGLTVTASKSGAPDVTRPSSYSAGPVVAIGEAIPPLVVLEPPYFFSGSTMASSSIGAGWDLDDIQGNPEPYDTIYEWMVDGIIQADNGQFLSISSNFVGRTITARLTMGKSGASSVTSMTAPTPPISPAGSLPVPFFGRKPVISGSARAGSTLSVGFITVLNQVTSTAFQWLRDGDPIVGATAQNYTIQAEDIGSVLSAQVIASNATGPSDPVTTLPTAIVTA